MFSSSCNYNKLKSNLRICMQRLKLLQKKKTEVSLKSRKEVADYLKINKVDRARIRVEHIVREDYLVEAMEIVEMYCDLFISRFGLFSSQKTCDEGLKEAIATILWVSPRMQADVPELKIVREQIYLKYGKEFVDACLSNANTAVNPKVMRNLNLHAPPCNLCEMYLVEISRSYEVDFKPDPYLLSGGSGGSGGAAMPTAPLVNLGEPPAKPSYDHIFDRGPDCSNLPYPMEPSKDMDSSHMTIPALPKKTDDDSAYIDLDTPPPYPSGNESGKKKVGSSDDSDSDHVYAGMPNDHTGDQDASGKASPPAAPKPSNFNDDDFDDLSARFNRLKQSK